MEPGWPCHHGYVILPSMLYSHLCYTPICTRCYCCQADTLCHHEEGPMAIALHDIFRFIANTAKHTVVCTVQKRAEPRSRGDRLVGVRRLAGCLNERLAKDPGGRRSTFHPAASPRCCAAGSAGLRILAGKNHVRTVKMDWHFIHKFNLYWN